MSNLATSQQVRHWIDSPQMREKISNALGGYMSGDMFVAQVALAVQDPAVARCSPTSVFNAMLEVATMGLLPGKAHNHVALIPRRNELTVMPQWQGLKHLMERQAHVRSVTAHLVHELDDVAVEMGIVTRHEYDPFDPDRVFAHWSSGKSGLRGGYARIEYTDGSVSFHFVTAAKIKANADCAQNQSNWKKWFPEYCSKTVLRDCYARRAIRLEPETEGRLGLAVQAIDAAEENNPERGGHAVKPVDARKLPKGQDTLAEVLAATPEPISDDPEVSEDGADIDVDIDLFE